MKTLKVAFIGKMRSGKSTATDIAMIHMMAKDKTSKTLSFGNKLKEVAHDLFQHVRSVEGKDRKLYQDFGQLAREIDENVFVSHVEADIDRLENKVDAIFIDDTRQPNEYKMIRDKGFVVVKIETSEEERIKRMKAKGDNFSKEDLTHDTESHIDGFGYDYKVINNGNFEEFADEIVKLMKSLQ